MQRTIVAMMNSRLRAVFFGHKKALRRIGLWSTLTTFATVEAATSPTAELIGRQPNELGAQHSIISAF